jgi:hypothetical protein
MQNVVMLSITIKSTMMVAVMQSVVMLMVAASNESTFFPPFMFEWSKLTPPCQGLLAQLCVFLWWSNSFKNFLGGIVISRNQQQQLDLNPKPKRMICVFYQCATTTIKLFLTFFSGIVFSQNQQQQLDLNLRMIRRCYRSWQTVLKLFSTIASSQNQQRQLDSNPVTLG